jgi:hypothetical protein
LLVDGIFINCAITVVVDLITYFAGIGIDYSAAIVTIAGSGLRIGRGVAGFERQACPGKTVTISVQIPEGGIGGVIIDLAIAIIIEVIT